MASHIDRRRFVQLAGAGVALSAAGCSALQSDGTTTGGTTTGDDPDGAGAGSATVTLRLQLGQQARQELQRRQLQIQSQIRSGNLSQSEGQSRIREASAELYGEAIDAFETEVASESNITVEDALESYGLVLVSGSPDALVDSLSTETVGSMYPESAFERARTRAQQGPSTPTGGTTGTPPQGSPGTPAEEITGTLTEESTGTPTDNSTGTPSE